jgi:hypothetical protein
MHTDHTVRMKSISPGCPLDTKAVYASRLDVVRYIHSMIVKGS